jgi:hypothetical protein
MLTKAQEDKLISKKEDTRNANAVTIPQSADIETLYGGLHQLANAIRAAAAVAHETPGWSRSLYVARTFFDGEVFKHLEVSLVPSRQTKPKELVRVDFDLLGFASLAGEVVTLLRMELEPFIIGVGQVRIEEIPEGLAVMLSDNRDAA